MSGKQGEKACHLVGVAGVGMNALAQALQGRGWDVSGSDRFEDQGQDIEIIRKLKQAGIRFYRQDGSGVTRGTGALVVSTAIEEDNPDVKAARALGIPVRHRSEMLADLAGGQRIVAIAGTSGKTTVTGMVGWILEQVGADPFVVNGGVLVNWADDATIGNVRLGRSGLCVIEADESDRSLLNFEPEWALITNASADHFDLPTTMDLFEKFRKRVRRDCVLGWEDGAGWRNARVVAGRNGIRFRYGGTDFEVPLLGEHNAVNAMQAAELCRRMGYEPGAVAGALRKFRGIQRRLEKVGEAAGVTVLDEYAHNPAKIAAAWRAVAPHHRRVRAFWRPHGFKPLSLMFDELVSMFSGVCRADDRLFVMPVFYAGGTVSRQEDSDQFVAALQKAGVPAEWAADYDGLMQSMLADLAEGDVVLCMGARDPGIPAFARALVKRLGGAGG